MHEVVTVTTSLAGAGAVALPAPSTRPASAEPGAVPAYRVGEFSTDTVVTGGSRTVS